jgi:ATP-dependent Clp protease ATP-binding subunit ClpA
VFELFTERARRVVVLAHEEAQALKHNYIGTEHLLLGVLRLPDARVETEILDTFGLTVDTVRDNVTRIVGLGEGVTPGQIPFTPRSKTALELSVREAIALGQTEVDSEHILLALARVRDGVAMRILLDAGADDNTLRAMITTSATGDRLGHRLEVIEALVLAFDRRGEIVEAVARAANRTDAEAAVAQRLNLSARQAQAVLAVRLTEWTEEEVASRRNELARVRARLQRDGP